MLKSRLISLLAGTILGLAAVGVAQAAPPAKAFGELPVGYDSAISPSGERLAVIRNVDGEYVVVVQSISGEKMEPWLLTLGDKLKPRFVKWVNEDRFVISVRQGEKFRGTPFSVGYLFSGDVKTRESDFVVRTNKIFRQFNDVVVDWLEDDPDHILMAYSDDQWDPYPDIKKVNVNTGRGKTVKRGVNNIEYWMTDDDGTPRIGKGASNKGVKRFIIYDDASDQWNDVEEYPGLDVDTQIFGMLNDGREVVYGDYNGRDTLGLYIYDLVEKRQTRELFHNDKFDASGVVLSKDGKTVIGAKYTSESDKTELLGEYDTLMQRVRSKFSEYDVNYVDQTEGGDTVIVKLSAPYDPGGMIMFRSDNMTPIKISDMYSGLRSDDLGDVVPISYMARDGQKIPAFVTLPPTITTTAQFKNLPFIILPHGGPYGRDAKRFDYFAQFFATRGYAVLQMNFRGSDGYGKAFEEAGRSNWIVMQEDVEDGMRYLLSKGYADPDRTCIGGWSYGGYAALMGAANHPELYKCVIAMAALTDINDAKRDLKKYRGGKAAAKEFFGEAMQDSAVRKANSPVHRAGDITAPVFLAHGDQDQNVQFDQFIRMKKALKKAGVNATFMEFEEEDHYLSRQKNREAFFVGVDKFLTKVNGKSEYMKD